MKNILKKLYIAVCGVGLFTLSSCSDYLDVSDEIADNLTLEDVFNNKGYVERWHSNIFNCISHYEFMGGSKENGFLGVWNVLCGEVSPNGGNAYTVMRNGFTADTAPFHRWSALYKYIRQALILLEHIKSVGASNSLDDTYLSPEQVERMKMEAKFFIAYSYFSLFELYGPVPIVKEIADPDNPNFTDYPRASVDEMVKYIDDLLVEIINSNVLPQTTFASGGISENTDHSNSDNTKYALSEAVRPTKATALALRAKLWVYAASPLMNGGYPEAMELNNPDGSPIFPARSQDKWQTAKQHLETFLHFAEEMGYGLFEVMNNDGTVDADNSLYKLYQYYNDEIIWATNDNGYYAVNGEMEKRSNPRGVYNGWANLGVFQETVDAFFMENGLEINDPDNNYFEEGFADLPNRVNEDFRTDENIYMMYHNREPRFYASITYEGRSWHVQPPGNTNYVTSFAKGGDTDLSRLENPKTGYMLYKFKNRQVYGTTRPASGNKKELYKQWARPNILLRLADFYLYYAEVCNELSPSDPNIIEYIDRVRHRAGIPGYKELKERGIKDIIGDQAKQRWAIQRERQVELLCEGQRYFDIRRWMTADDANNAFDQQLVRNGMDMTGENKQEVGNGSFFNRVEIEKRAWTRAMLLYPIPYDEIQRSPGKILVQNPLW